VLHGALESEEQAPLLPPEAQETFARHLFPASATARAAYALGHGSY
jgi:hypothetical protein